MKKIIVLGRAGLHPWHCRQAVACDFGARAANATPTVVATTEEPSTQQPAAKPEAAAPKVVTDKPLPLHLSPWQMVRWL